jgi:hypothetical protein
MSAPPPPLDLSHPPPPPLDPRDAAVARLPASSGVLFPSPSGELEGDGPEAVLYIFFAVSPVLQWFFWDVATDDFRVLQ